MDSVNARVETRPTQEYSSLDIAYDWFNERLFGGHLPACMITLHRKANAAGYYAHERWQSRFAKGEKTSEIALNPDAFIGRTDMEILSTLVHEMAHLWQFYFGEPSRNGYHNKSWGDKMESIGLMPSETGMPGGKKTGQKMTHYIILDGPFNVACKDLLDTGWSFFWESETWDAQAKPKPVSKVKYTCPTCGQNAWAKPGAQLGCWDCNQFMDTFPE